MKLTNFPILIPAFTAQIHIDAPLPITADLLAIPFLPSSGRLVSEPSYPYALRATFVHGSDYLRRDPDGRHVRLDVRSVARDERSGALLKFSYNGVVDVTGDAGRVMTGDSNASTTAFGSAFVQVRFETHDSRLRDIENKLYVGSGRFIVQERQPIVVEYKISEVAAACGER